MATTPEYPINWNGKRLTIAQAANFAGISVRAMQTRIKRWPESEWLKPRVDGAQETDDCNTLCVRCGNFAGGCEWADRFEPVPGWEAKETGRNSYYGGSSYDVIACPKFRPDNDPVDPQSIDDDAVMNLAVKIFAGVADDYVRLGKKVLADGSRRDRMECARLFLAREEELDGTNLANEARKHFKYETALNCAKELLGRT